MNCNWINLFVSDCFGFLLHWPFVNASFSNWFELPLSKQFWHQFLRWSMLGQNQLKAQQNTFPWEHLCETQSIVCKWGTTVCKIFIRLVGHLIRAVKLCLFLVTGLAHAGFPQTKQAKELGSAPEIVSLHHHDLARRFVSSVVESVKSKKEMSVLCTWREDDR